MSYLQQSPIPVISGGTGAITLTNHGVLLGAGTAAINPLAVAASGTVLIGNNAADPSFSATPTVSSLTASAGDITISAGNLILPLTTSSSLGVIKLGTSSFISMYGTANTFIGQAAGNFTLTTGINAYDNTGIGYQTLKTLTTGQDNTALGASAGQNFTTGKYNVLLGANSGTNYTTSESSNILIGYLNLGTASESNTLRIGSATGVGFGQLNATYISGITGVTITGGSPVLISAGNQLGVGVVGVSGGGTGIATTTPYSVICAGTTATNPFQSLAALGAAGTVLTSAGAGALPSFLAPAASSISITGDTGGALTGASFTLAGGTTGLSFGGAGSTETLTFAGITANGGVVNLGTDNAANAVNIGVGTTARAIHIGDSAAAHVITIGSVTGAASITERVGTGNYSLDGNLASTYTIGASTTTGTYTLGGTAQTGTITLGSSSGTNIIAIGAGAGATTLNLVDAQTAGAVNVGAGMTTGTITIGGTGLQTGTITIGGGTGAQIVNLGTGGTGVKTVNVGTGAVANVVTVGTVTGASSLALKSGSGNIIMNAGLTIDSTGRNYNTVQPAFFAYVTATTAAVTGDGTGYVVIFGTSVYNQGTSYSTSTGIFTAPISGRYLFTAGVTSQTFGTTSQLDLIFLTTGTTIIPSSIAPTGNNLGGNNYVTQSFSTFANMGAGDTAKVELAGYNGTKTIKVIGAATSSWFAGALIC